ncbi:MAG TPA: HlyD family efflux transporter periplasmic adaptor subunit [Cytophagaceae bacterium]|jgi:HlyD family secretion protein
MDKVIEKKKKTWWQLSLYSLLPLSLLSILYLNLKDVNIKKLKLEVSKITIAEVTKGNFIEYIPIEGMVMPFKSVYLDAVEGGIVEQIYKEDGATVAINDPILRLSNTELQLNIMQREAGLFELMDQLQTTKINYEKNRTSLLMNLSDLEYQLLDAERIHEANVGLYADKVISKKEYNEAENKFRYLKNKAALTKRLLKQDSLSSNEQIRQMRASIQRMDKNMEVMKSKLDNLIVRAPAAGQLTSLSAEVGELKPIGKNLGQIDILDNFKIHASIDEYYINRVYRDQTAKLELDDHMIELMVHKIYPNVKGGKFQVDLVFRNANDLTKIKSKIRRGQSLRLRLEMSDEKEALLIPKGSFYQQTGGNWIFILNKGGDIATRKDIKVGRQNPENFEILEGLKPGEKVITSGYDGFGEAEQIILEE